MLCKEGCPAPSPLLFCPSPHPFKGSLKSLALAVKVMFLFIVEEKKTLLEEY